MLNDKLVIYLINSCISFDVEDFIVIKEDGKNEQILYWNEEKLGQIPTEEQLDLAFQQYLIDQESVAYKEKRLAEYPDFREYLDGIVKGDQEQIQTYIDACLAIKQKYPKM